MSGWHREYCPTCTYPSRCWDERVDQKANEVDWLKSKGAGVQSVIDSQWVTKWVNSTQHLRKEQGYLCLIHFQVIPFLAPASFILPSTLSGTCSKKCEPPAWKVGGCEKFSARITRRAIATNAVKSASSQNLESLLWEDGKIERKIFSTGCKWPSLNSPNSQYGWNWGLSNWNICSPFIPFCNVEIF